MGIYTDILANTVEVDTSAGRVALSKQAVRELNAYLTRRDPDLLGTLTAASEVQTVAQHTGTPTAGTFTMTINVADGTSVTTAAIAYDAIASVVESAIDTAASGTIANWTNGDIAVAAAVTTLVDGDMSLTFSGASVSNQNQPLASSVGTITGGDVGPITEATAGQPNREFVQFFYDQGVVSGAVPAQGETPVWTALPVADNPSYPSQWLIQEMALDATVVEGTDNLWDALKALDLVDRV